MFGIHKKEIPAVVLKRNAIFFIITRRSCTRKRCSANDNLFTIQSHTPIDNPFSLWFFFSSKHCMYNEVRGYTEILPFLSWIEAISGLPKH